MGAAPCYLSEGGVNVTFLHKLSSDYASVLSCASNIEDMKTGYI